MTQRFILIFLFGLTFLRANAQEKEGVAISGTVFISSSRSQGILNGKTYYEGEGRFKNQVIYFSNDTNVIQSKTDSAGIFQVALKPGPYSVYQEPYIKGQSRGLISFGSGSITVTKKDESFTIRLHNTVNGRQAISDNERPRSKNKKTSPVNSTKQN